MLRGAVVVCLLFLASGSAWAQLRPIPEESGFDGFVNLGALYGSVSSNMVVGAEPVDIGNSVTTSLTESPDSTNDVIPLYNFDVRYTFASTRTQVFFGNNLEDLLRFDVTMQAGVRQGFSERSSVSASLVFTSFPAQVWEDPYVVNTPRVETDRSSIGARLNWDKILNSDFTIQYTFRDIEIDRELSGLTQLGLAPAQASLLDREGDSHRVDVGYAWTIAPRHILVPTYRYTKLDLNGDAMANDRHALQLSYVYHGDPVTVSANVEYARSNYNAVHPIYLTTRDDDFYAGGLQLFWHGPFGAPKELSLLGTLVGIYSDSNIDFYDETVYGAGLSLFYQF